MQGDGQAAPSDARLDQSTIYQRLSRQGSQVRTLYLYYVVLPGFLDYSLDY